MKFLIYQDYVFNKGILFDNLRTHYPQASIEFCDAAVIRAGALGDDISLFVMPGGADLYYCEKLDDQAAAKIRAYVERGGRYLGICAGAYFACREIEWAKGHSAHEICGPRPLKFAPAKAVGPVYDFIEARDIDASWMGVARIEYQGEDDGEYNETVLPCLYEAGPVFSFEDQDHNKQDHVIARYHDLPGKPPAILEYRIGDGRAILSGVHFEALPSARMKSLYRHDNPSLAYEKACLEQLLKHEDRIKEFQKTLYDRLLQPADLDTEYGEDQAAE